MPRVAVIGGGIAGLSAAYRLHEERLEPVVFEASDRVGGVIRSERSGGYLVEHGPNSIQSSSETVETMIRRLGLEDQRVGASEEARNRFIVKGERPQPAPTSPAKLLKSGLFGTGAKLRVLREPFIAAGDPRVEESVADFIRRRLGSQVLDYGINPFVGGVYAGDPERLSVRHAFPSLYEMEQEFGSIIKGQVEKRRGAVAAAATYRMFSFREGIEQLPLSIAAVLGGQVRTNSPVDRLALEGKTWTIDSESFRAVVYAAPLHRLADIDLPAGVDTSRLEDVDYPPLSVVALGYRRTDVGHPLDGFGMLVPEVERPLRILGSLFTSTIFPERAPEDHVLLTSFVGGMRNPELAKRSPHELYQTVHDDLAKLLDVTAEPVFRRHVFWEHSIPQYNLGYGEVQNALDRLERTLPGLFMAGNYRNGISVGDAANSGDEAGRRCAAYLG